ncbi:RNA-binding protein 4B [Lonchura striata]|uniref:RNA-binding protein 4B n=1 Tax=Lonchura striata TaxID=40157 RepID=A0A218UBN2_9PASE|nr:RNA-binding protein 4B [Lonchura striata domestica]
MVKLFIGNLPREATEQEIRSLFEQYGKVLECDIIKNYGFVHIEDKTAAEDAIRNLHHHKLHGVCINVEASKNKSKASTKLHVGNISPACTNLELRAKFEEYGPVIECDIVKDYAFVHMERAEDAVEAIRGLDNTEFQDAYDRALLPTPGAAAAVAAAAATAAAAAASSTYYTRDRSPLRRTAAAAGTVGEAYTYERGQLSPVSSVARASLYDLQRFERDPYGDRARYSAF